MAFLSSPAPLPLRSSVRVGTACRPRVCPLRLTATPPTPSDDNAQQPPTPPPRKLPVTNSPPSTRKLVRNKDGAPSAGANQYADARAGDMVGAPEVGEGLGPRRGVEDKKVTRAAAIQKSQTFADAWAEQNEGRVDVWLIIGAVTLLTPILILIWGIVTGVIPTGGLFDE